MSLENGSSDCPENTEPIASTSSPVISIAWRNLRYEVNDFRHFHRFRPAKKALLQRLNGFCEANTLSALMGPSGAGKTTLLNCLSGTTVAGLTADSEIFISGDRQASPVSYFIQQHIQETIAAKLTVQQILEYAFKFKNGIQDKVTEQMCPHIITTMRDLLLNEDILKRTFERCSGGEQRRIAIAQELMALQKPDFLFIDEPTSGLDSFAALEMVRCLAQLAAHSQLTIIASIHAPSYECLQHFGKLYVLAKGGVCIYSGPPKELTFDLLGTTFEGQPIETLIKVACSSLNSPQVQALADRFLHSEFQTICAHLPALTRLPSSLPCPHKCFSFVDLALQIGRQSRITFLAHYRLFLAQLLLFILIIVGFASFFNRNMVLPRGCSSKNATVCENDILSHLVLTENINYLCLMRTNETYIIMVISAMFYSSVISVFRNEHRNSWYSLGVFYGATSFVSFLEVTIFSLVLAPVAYYSAFEQAIDEYHLNWLRLGHYTFCTFIALLFTQSLGQLVGAAIIGSVEIAIILSSTAFTFILLLDDFFFKTDELHQQFFTDASNVIAMKYVTRYLIWIFYGIDRCDEQTEYSWILVKHYADGRQIGFYIARILMNTLALRLLTLLLLYIKFNVFSRQKSTDSSAEQVDKPLVIDYNHNEVSIDLLNANAAICKRNKADVELHFEQFSKNRVIIAWRNLTLFGSRSLVELNYSSDVQHSIKPILRRLNGEFRFGTLTALMGMSGAGKTSLLNVINGRHHSRLSSESTFHLSKFTRIETAFIAQEVSGHLMRGLTPRQLLVYASKLKNHSHEVNGTVVDHEAIALKLLDELNLADTVNTKVEYCSGGERKRLALALELTPLQMPNLICIDEPTSGLDSNSAAIVISTLRSLTQHHPITIIASIHQPNTELLLMFDQLYVLALGGICVYSGPPTQLEAHLKQLPEISLDGQPPIECLIKYSSTGAEGAVVQRLAELTQSSCTDEKLGIDTQLAPGGVLLNRARFSLLSVVILSQRYCTYLCGYLWKEWLPFVLFYLSYGFNLSLFFDPSIAVPSGCMDLEEDFNSTCTRSAERQLEEKLLYDNLKYNLFFSNLFVMVVMMQTPLNLYKELDLFFNEHRNGWYSTGSFYLMRTIAEVLPLLPLLAVYVYIGNIYATIIPGIYPHLVLVLLLTIVATQALAYIFLLLANLNMTLSMILGISSYIIMLLLSNLYNSLNRLHYVYQWLSYLSIPHWTFQQLLLLEYGFGRCGPRQIQPILYYMEIAEEDYTFGLSMLVLNLLFYRGVALWMLSRKVNSKRQNADS